jgi:large subunit ribosomal protein L24
MQQPHGDKMGEKGQVRYAYPDQNRVMVEGVNFIKKHAKAKKQARQAGIIEREAPISASNVMLMCGKCEHPVRVGYKKLEDGRRVRACRACGEVIE